MLLVKCPLTRDKTVYYSCSGKFPNSSVQFYSKILEDIIRKQKIKTVVIFGLCADNDYHIIRDLQFYMGSEKHKMLKLYFATTMNTLKTDF